MPFYERQPYIQPLYLTVSEVLSGVVRIPKFQRAGTESTWSPEQRGDLLDSLYRGYPIGTILLWSTKDPIKTIDVVGGYHIPAEDTKNESIRLLLDGHQRLSTLVQILGAGLSDANREQDHENTELWAFDLVENNDLDSRDRFILIKPGIELTASQVPLGIILNRSSLNRWIRDHQELSDWQIQEADSLRDRLREYSIPVTVLGANSLEEATISFKRINSSGTDMSNADMVFALAYSNNFDPRESFEEAKEEYLSEYGRWIDISDSDVLRVCSGLINHDPSKINVEVLAKK